jgi:hypothetical protein
MKWLYTLGLLVLCGCQYDFTIVQPADHAAVIGAKAPTSVVLPPVEYGFQAAEGRLVMEIRNPGKDAVVVDGTRSSIVDPAGESHPLQGQLIPGGAYAKFILPPMRHEHGPPDFLHVGVIAQSTNGVDGTLGAPIEPVYMGELDPPDDWDWHGETNIRVTVTILHGADAVVHEFEFHRHKL